MTFNWYEYLLLAHYLNNANTFHYPEALQRSAVSRAYYAAFCSAKEYAEIKFRIKFSSDTNVHYDVRNTFKKNNRDDISDNLNDLRILRNKCDYQNNVQNLHIMVKTAIQLAEDIISHL
jgi:hypothetical protein